jgi:GT2 family glycosyltransferase
MESSIGILILFHNKLSQTIECIESFMPSGQNIYVLNNGSDKSLWTSLQKKYSKTEQVKFFNSDTNLGVSAGRNLLVKKAKEPWLLIVDNDIIIKDPANWVATFYGLVKQNPTTEIFTFHIYNVHEGNYVKPIKIVKEGKNVSVQEADKTLTNCFPGTGSVVHQNIFKKYGLFDESLFVGFEDYEYAIRCMLSAHGQLKALHVNDIEMIHDHRFSAKKEDKNAVKERYNEQRIKESYENLVKRYDIVFDHDWEWWTKKQINDMTKNPFLQKIKQHVKKALGR